VRRLKIDLRANDSTMETCRRLWKVGIAPIWRYCTWLAARPTVNNLIMANQLAAHKLDELRGYLLGGEGFLQLANSFIDDTALAMAPTERKGVSFVTYRKTMLQAFTKENAGEVEELAQSPIEKTFLNSLILTFIRGSVFGLLVQRTFDDTPKEVAEFRDYLRKFHEFRAWFKENKPADTVELFLDRVLKDKGISQDERDRIVHRMMVRYYYIPMEKMFHMTLQPRFPNIKIDGKQIRPDIYFWIPSRPDINVIVECDGYAHHSDKGKFKADRQRDRALKSLGYDVLRFSGSEIYNDPVHTPYELATYLRQRERGSAPQVAETIDC
jgi:very-short-patch-repair endonuclease